MTLIPRAKANSRRSAGLLLFVGAVGLLVSTAGIVRAAVTWGTSEPASFASGVQNAAPDTIFYSVSCESAGNCAAAGMLYNAAGRYVAFTQTSTGGVWGTASPASFASGVQYTQENSYFNSVSCGSAGNCTAVGQFRNAAGGYEAFTQTSTGGVWGTAEPASFASGVQHANRYAVFNSVSCGSVGNCTAAGNFRNAAGHNEAFTQTSTGGVWGTAVPASFASGVQNATPDASFYSVSCESVGNCTAAGFFRNASGGNEAFTQSSTGGVWGTAVPASFASGVQNANRYAVFNSVSCESAGNCTAAGRFRNAAGGYEAFTQTSTGGVWGTAVPASFASGVQDAIPEAIFYSVSCGSVGNCTAAGRFKNAAGGYEAFTQTSTGGVWGTAEPASFASGVQNAAPNAIFSSVSCGSAGNCTAAGRFSNAAGNSEAFTQTLTGGVWGTPEPASFASGVQDASPDAYFTSVSCGSAGNCTAAGQFWNATGGYEAFTQTATSPVAPTTTVAPSTTVAPTTTVAPSTTVVPMTTVAPSSLPATGSDGPVNVLIGMSLLLCGFGLRVWRRRSI